MKPSVFLLDNYDSFTYNIVHALRELGVEPTVVRNDQVDLDAVAAYDKIIISPGPGIPTEAGRLMELLDRYADRKPILGVCLGHQAIAQHFGAQLVNLPTVYHGLQLPINVTANDYMFESLLTRFDVGRYHSWAVDAATVPDCLEVTAVDDDGVIMALRHKTLDVRGVQFHPESIMTAVGMQMFKNWFEFGSAEV